MRVQKLTPRGGANVKGFAESFDHEPFYGWEALGPAQVALGPAQVPLGPAQVALGLVQVSLGPAQVALGPAQVALGAVTGTCPCGRVQPPPAIPSSSRASL